MGAELFERGWGGVGVREELPEPQAFEGTPRRKGSSA